MNGSGRPLEHVRRNDASGRPLSCSLVSFMNGSGRPLEHVRIELATSERCIKTRPLSAAPVYRSCYRSVHVRAHVRVHVRVHVLLESCSFFSFFSTLGDVSLITPWQKPPRHQLGARA